MPNGLKDIGGGQKLVDFSGSSGGNTSPLDTANKFLTLQNLLEDRKNAPLLRKKLEIETGLKTNELLNLNVTNLLKQAQLSAAVGAERRAQSKHITEALSALPDLFRKSPGLADAALKQVIPEAQTAFNEDGTFTIDIPSTEKKLVNGQEQEVPSRDSLSFSVDPKRLTPEKRFELEGQWQDRFRNSDAIKKFPGVSLQWANLQKASKLATGASDTSMLYSYMLILEPGARVTEGDIANAQNAQNVPERIINLYNKSLVEGGPIFGKKVDSPARVNIVNAAKLFYENSRADALAAGRDIAEVAKRERLDARNILTPVGDISENDFLMTDAELLKQAKEAARK